MPNIRDRSTAARFWVSAGAGALGALLMGVLGPWWLIPLAYWDAAALVFVGWMWHMLWPMAATQTADHARREDPGRPGRETLLLSASVASLAAVGLVLVRAGHTTGLEKSLLLGTSIVSIVLSWGVTHTVFALRYARLYYERDARAVNFNEDGPPCYTDFAYLALTVGMTSQVSDTNLQTKTMRRTALRHAFLSYAFGTLIIGTTVNLIAGLGN
jgi:uncharacterized membrane protein